MNVKRKGNGARKDERYYYASQWRLMGRKFKRHKLAMAATVVLVLFYKVNVGLTGFAVAMVLSFLHVADEGEAIKRIPWGTLLLITGVGVLMHIIIKLGGIKLLSEALASIMTPATAVTTPRTIAHHGW